VDSRSSVIRHRCWRQIAVFTRLKRCVPVEFTEGRGWGLICRLRDPTRFTALCRRTPHRGLRQGVPAGCFCCFLFAFCSRLLILCFRLLSLSFLPLSPIAYLLFQLPGIFSPRGRPCVACSVFAHFYEYTCFANSYLLTYIRYYADCTSAGGPLSTGSGAASGLFRRRFDGLCGRRCYYAARAISAGSVMTEFERFLATSVGLNAHDYKGLLPTAAIHWRVHSTLSS